MAEAKFNSPSYYVTTCGRVWSYNTNRFIKPQMGTNGYRHVTMYIDHRKVTVSLHVLVAVRHIPNQNGYIQVNHKDGDKSHNWVGNLEWCNNSMNVQHAYDTGLHKPVTANTKSVISPNGTEYVSIAEASRVTGTTYSVIWKACNRDNGKWRYK